jgi:hypothetical protein
MFGSWMSWSAISASLVEWGGIMAVPLAVLIGIPLTLWAVGFLVSLLWGRRGPGEGA